MRPAVPLRHHLLLEGARFFGSIIRVPGVIRVAVIGSILTTKTEPNDIDMLVSVSAQCDLAQVAAIGRKLKGRAQERNAGADIFLTDPNLQYIGRTCSWKECTPGIRLACKARHCGRHVNDDLQILTLRSELTCAPPLELWPTVVRRCELPEDVERLLLQKAVVAASGRGGVGA